MPKKKLRTNSLAKKHFPLRFNYEIISKKKKETKIIRKNIKLNFGNDPSEKTPTSPWLYGHENCGKPRTPACSYCKTINRIEETMKSWK